MFKELDSAPHFEFSLEELMAALCGTGSPLQRAQ